MLELNSVDSNSNFTTLKLCQSPKVKFSILTLLEIHSNPEQKLKKQNMLFTRNNRLGSVC